MIRVLEGSLWVLSFTLKFLSCNAGFVGSFAACCGGMRNWPLKGYVVFLTKGWSPPPLPISCLMCCRSHSLTGLVFLLKVPLLACSMFILYSYDFSEASGINLEGQEYVENRNRISNPQNLIFVQFKWKISKFIKEGGSIFILVLYLECKGLHGERCTFLIK